MQLPDEESAATGGNLTVFLFFNSLLLLLGILIFLIGRNLVKLIFDRRKGILGAKLRSRLVLAFVGLTLIPTAILFWFAHSIVMRAMNGWFSAPVELALSGSREIARRYVTGARELAFAEAKRLSLEFERAGTFPNKHELEKAREELKLFALDLVGSEGRIVARAYHPTAEIENFKPPDFDKLALERAQKGEFVQRSEERGSQSFVRIYTPLRIATGGIVLVVTVRFDPEIAQALSQIKESYTEYEQVKFLKNPLRSSNVLVLSVVTAVIMFAAIWIGFFIARQITIPIQKLAEGTQLVARGQYDVTVDIAGDDELGYLVRSFNRMTSDLRRTSAEAERRRLFLENTLANVVVGVIALDSKLRVVSINEAARSLFLIPVDNDLELAELSAVNEFSLVVSLVEQAYQDNETEALSQELKLESPGGKRKVICSVGVVRAQDGTRQGCVVILDDVTELSKAQHVAAWREVARRVAHEIKNPLTPIQLAAQRLERLAANLPEHATFSECAGTIVQNVDSIKRLANEFSQFARMPTAQMQKVDLDSLVNEVVSSYAGRDVQVRLQVTKDAHLEDVDLDPDQIRRLLINLIDNAIAAVSTPLSEAEGQSIIDGLVSLRLAFENRRQRVQIEVADNGPGIPAAQRARIFEPYFTTKREGSGLGLTIVSSIVADHQGEIRVFDNEPHGARFFIEFPLRQPGFKRALKV